MGEKGKEMGNTKISAPSYFTWRPYHFTSSVDMFT